MITAILILNVIIILVSIIGLAILIPKGSEEDRERRFYGFLVCMAVVLLCYIAKDLMQTFKPTVTTKNEPNIEQMITIKNGVSDTSYVYRFNRND